MSQLIVIPTLTEALPLIRSAGFIQTEDPILFQKPDSEWRLVIAGVGTVPVIYNLTKHFATHRYEKVIHG